MSYDVSSDIGFDLLQCFKEFIKVFLKDHDGGSDKFLAVLAAFGDLYDPVAIVLFLQVKEIGSFARLHFLIVEIFVLLFHW